MDDTLHVDVPRRAPLGTRLVSYLSSLSPDLRRIMLIGLIEAFCVNGYISVLMPYYRTLGFDSRAVGSLNSVQSIAGMILGATGGLVADVLGRKKMYVAGQVARTVAVVMLLLTANFPGLVLVALLRGAASIQIPAQSALLASYTRKDNRATMLGIFQTLAQFAAVVAPLLAGLAAQSRGVRLPFGAALFLSAFAVFLALPLKDPSGSSASRERPDSIDTAKFLQRVREVFSGPRRLTVVLLLAASLANGIANGATNVILPFTVMDRFSSAYTVMSTVQSFFALGTMLVLLAGGRLADLKGRRAVVMTSGAVFPIFMTGIFFVRSLWQLYAVGMLVTMAGNISSPAMSAAYMEAVEEKHRATFAGLHLGVNSLGMAVGSFLGGISYSVSPTGSWIWVIALFSSQLIAYHIVLPRE